MGRQAFKDAGRLNIFLYIYCVREIEIESEYD